MDHREPARRPHRRPFQIHRRRRHLEAAHQGSAHKRARARPHRLRHLRPAIQIASTRWWTPRREVGGLYRSDDAGESWQRVNHEERIWGRGCDFAWVRVVARKSTTSFTSATLPRIAPLTAARPSPPSKALPAATTTTPSGSIPRIRRSFLLAARPRRHHHRQRRRHLELAGTTSRPRSSTTSSPTINFPTGSTAGSRKAARRASPAAATGAKSRFATGIRWAPKNMATSRPIRCIPNLIYGGKVTRFDMITGQMQDVSPACCAPANTASIAPRR